MSTQTVSNPAHHGQGIEHLRTTNFGEHPGFLVHHFSHQLSKGPTTVEVVSYVSEGLTSLTGHDLVVCLRDSEVAKYEPHALSVLLHLYRLAAQGQHFGPGDHVEMQGPFGHSECALGFLPHNAWQDGLILQSEPSLLRLVLAVGDEIELVRDGGLHRLAGALAHLQDAFPYPILMDPERVPYVDGQELSASLSLNMTHAPVWAASYVMDRQRQRLTLRIEDSMQASLQALAPHWQDNLALFPRPSSWTDGCLVLTEKGGSAVAISRSQAHPECLTGTSLVFMGAQSKSFMKPFEDGFLVGLDEPASDALKQALLQGHNLEWLLDDGQQLLVQWLYSELFSPHLVILHTDQAVATQAWVEAITEETESFAFERQMPDLPHFNITVVAWPNGDSRCWVEGQLPAGWSQELERRLMELNGPELTGDIAFSLWFGLSPDIDVDKLPAPRAWSELNFRVVESKSNTNG